MDEDNYYYNRRERRRGIGATSPAEDKSAVIAIILMMVAMTAWFGFMLHQAMGERDAAQARYLLLRDKCTQVLPEWRCEIEVGKERP